MLTDWQIGKSRHGRFLRALFLIFILVGSLTALVLTASGQEGSSNAPENLSAPVAPAGNAYGDYLPTEMSYQGQIVDGSGVPQVGSYAMQFGVYGPPPTYTLRYTEIQTIATDPDGLFNVMIGAVQPGLDIALAGGDAWLQVQLDGEILAPLQPIGTVPYAQYAQKLVGGTGAFSAIGGGDLIQASGDYAAVSGGYDNIASGYGATIGGGRYNRAAGGDSVIAGGSFNSAYADAGVATIGGGFNNTVTDTATTIAGGYNNSAQATYSSIGGGIDNITAGDNSVIGGGSQNTTTGLGSTIGGGFGHNADGQYATIGGGEENLANGYAASVAGGRLNSAAGYMSAIPGGVSNYASGNSSLAAGAFASAVHDHAFVWSDGTTISFASTDANQFLIHATGGMGVNTNAPQSQLHVVDTLNGNATDLSAHVATIENDSTDTSPDVLALVAGAANPGGSVNYVTFFDSSGAIAAIEGNGSGGVAYVTSGADLAEYLPLHTAVSHTPEPGTVLGLTSDGLHLNTADAQRVWVVSSAAGFVGNAAAKVQDDMALVAFMGQVPVRVRGPVRAGDLLVASGLGDGTAVSITPAQLTPVLANQIVGQAMESSSGSGVSLVNTLVGQPNDAFWAAQLADTQSQLADLEARLTALEAALNSQTGANNE
ncbi:MAG: hypothetical protein H6664_14975 [Ardenticatenaceae bacterium]|nr:hypothetical protein [Ardenticatenaceae bacterium]MCB9005676.1 hypothetical protein [Ardenticatenaceae bacterium]